MIETTIPEINVVELMERVRAKAEEIRRLEARPKLPPIAGVKETPRAVLPTAVIPKTQKIVDAARDARQAVAVSRWIPKPLRGLFRRQDRFDRDVLRSIDSLAHTNGQLADRLRHLTACVEVQDHAIQHLADLRRQDGTWMQAVAEIIVTANERLGEARAAIQTDVEARITHVLARLDAVEAGIARAASSISELTGTTHLLSEVRDLTVGCRNVLDKAGEHLRNLQVQADSTRDVATGLRGDLDRTGEHLRNLHALHDQLATDTRATRSQVDVLTGEFRVIRDEFNRAGEHLRNLQAQVDSAVSKFGQPRHLHEALARLEQRLTDDGSYFKAEIAQQRTTLAHLLTGSRKKPGAVQRIDKRNGANADSLDSFYVSFEDRFRGSRPDIKTRLGFYVPIIKAAHAGSAQRPVLDLGCGRGEWLELLKDNGFNARGVDLNATMRAQCIERGLDVLHGDALDYLRRQKAGSCGAVTGFHIIEHLPFDALLQLIALAHRVLKPDGVVIFESPNCKNLVVGACNFNIDPTHRNPVYPETAEFILQLSGFGRTRIEYLAPVEGSPFTDNSATSKLLDARLFGPQDFGVIGYKSGGK
jgi:SAM-dependent methyltransferase